MKYSNKYFRRKRGSSKLTALSFCSEKGYENERYGQICIRLFVVANQTRKALILGSVKATGFDSRSVLSVLSLFLLLE